MSAPVWVLSVDLQTKTATFQSGMANAAKSARGAFSEIKSGADEMGGAVGSSAGSARQAVMLLGDEFGIHLPRGLTMFITSLGPVGAAMEAAFPFVAIALGVTLLLEHLAKLKSEGIQLTEDQVKFGTAIQMAFNALDEKILQAGIRTDELNNDHMGALRKQLELINKQSMDELVHSFAEVAKSADILFAGLKAGWYQLGSGSAGAQHALQEFQNQYADLLAKGKDKEASDLLRGTLDSAQKIANLQKNATAKTKGDGATGADFGPEVAKERAIADLRQMNIGTTEKEVQAQQTLVEALSKQLGIEERVATLKKADQGNASLTTGKEMAALQAEGARAAAEHSQKMGEISLSAAKEQADAMLNLQNASVVQRLASDIHFEDEEYKVKLAGNARLISALDKGGKDYNNQLRGLQEKAEELTAQHEANLSKLGAKAQEDAYKKSIQDVETGERAKIEATRQGSAQRLAAISAAIKEEEELGRQDASYYRDLLNERTQATRQAAEESAKLAADAGKEEAENTQKMGELTLAMEREQQALRDSFHRVTIQQRLSEETSAANQEYAIKMAAMQKEEGALEKDAKDYENKLKAIQNKEKQLVQQHENDITQIKDKAEIERNQKILSAETQFNDTITAGLTQVLMGHKSFASMMNAIGNEVVTGMLQNAIKSIEANAMGKTSDAEKAARQAYNIGLSMGGPVGMVLGPAFAAIAFSSVAAFQTGTDYVPGIGTGDKVPAMLEPGEGVVPGGVMDNLRSMARSGNMGGGNHYHAHMNPTYNLQALDSSGMDKILDKHAPTLAKHVNNELRKMNK